MRFRMTREMQIPKGAVKIADKQSDCVAYIYTANTAPCAMLFVGKSDKPAWRYRFASEAKRDESISNGFKQRRERMTSKAVEREKRKAWVNPYKVGDLFGRSWGYDQTNVNYYEVIESKGKFVTVREIAQEYVASGFMCGNTTPQPGKFLERSQPKRCLAQDGCIKINDCDWAYFKTPKMVAGVPVYGTEYTSSYA